MGLDLFIKINFYFVYFQKTPSRGDNKVEERRLLELGETEFSFYNKTAKKYHR